MSRNSLVRPLSRLTIQLLARSSKGQGVPVFLVRCTLTSLALIVFMMFAGCSHLPQMTSTPVAVAQDSTAAVVVYTAGEIVTLAEGRVLPVRAVSGAE